MSPRAKELAAALIQALVKEHPDKMTLDLIAPFDIKVQQVMSEVSIVITVKGLRLK